jgi:hypothetical protein
VQVLSVQIATCTESEYVPGAVTLGSLNVSVRLPWAPVAVNVIAVMAFFENVAPIYVPLGEPLWTVTLITVVGVELVSPFAVMLSCVGDTVRYAPFEPPPLLPPPPQALRHRTVEMHARRMSQHRRESCTRTPVKSLTGFSRRFGFSKGPV